MPNENSRDGAIPNENEAIYFQWEVPFRGFRWIDPPLEGQVGSPLPGESPKEATKRHLVPVREWNHVKWRIAHPLEDEKALFRTFADLEPEENQILEFANQHGQLKPAGELREIRPAGENPARGSNLADWAEPINDMKAVVQLWEAARSHDPKAFEDFMEIQDGEVVWGTLILPIVLNRLEIREIPQPASDLDGPQKLVWAAETVVKRIADHCIFWSGLRPRFDDGPTPSTLSLDFVPSSLIGAMWLQFAYWTQGGRSFPKCKHCEKRFAVGLDTRRVVADYCGDACKFKAHRIRKKRALELKAGGLRAAEIASLIGSKPAMVGKWIREARAQEKTIRNRVGRPRSG